MPAPPSNSNKKIYESRFYICWAPSLKQNLLWLEAGLHSWWVLDSSKTSLGVAQQVALKKKSPDTRASRLSSIRPSIESTVYPLFRFRGVATISRRTGP